MSMLANIGFGICFAFLGWFSSTTSSATQRHIRVTDDAGRPLANAVVTIAGQEFSTDKKGRLTVDVGYILSRKCMIEDVALTGYVFDSGLNPDCAFWEARMASTTEEHPFSVVLRKRISEWDLPCEVGHGISVCTADPNVTTNIDVDIFSHRARGLSKGYVDFSMTPRFDDKSKTWSMVFSTTNETSGLLAVRNRAPLAPASGYEKQIVVSENDYTSRNFTIFLRTRSPQIYAMLVPIRLQTHCPTPVGLLGRISQHQKHPLDFHLMMTLANLRGGRVFEYPLWATESDTSSDFEIETFLTERRHLPALDPEWVESRRAAYAEKLKLKTKWQDEEQVVETERRKLVSEADDGDARARKQARFAKWRELVEARKALEEVGFELRHIDPDAPRLESGLDPSRDEIFGVKNSLKSSYSYYLKMEEKVRELDSELRALDAGHLLPPAEPKPAVVCEPDSSVETYMPYRQDFEVAFSVSGRLAEKRACTFDVDLFQSAFDNGPGQYTDFSLTPFYDPKTRHWSVEFSTTNAACGLIATTNRVFMAPQDGYVQRVVVSEEDYTSPTFTLYLRTRTPPVYIMVAPRQKHRFCSSRDGMVFFGFFMDADDHAINLTGSRVLAPSQDEALQNIWGPDDARILTDEHRYPPLPDLDVRRANRARRVCLFQMRGEQVYEKTQYEVELRELLRRQKKGADVASQVSHYKRTIADAEAMIARFDAELKKLEQARPVAPKEISK